MRKICIIDGCGRKVNGRGLCSTHYSQWRRGVDIPSGPTNGKGNLLPLIDSIPGLTYRMVDYWDRTGRITLTANGNGSGFRREVTAVEAAALVDLVAELGELDARMARITSGEFFAERVAAHQDEAVAA